MPIYEITHPTTGQIIEMEGPNAPNEGQIRAAFAAVSSQSSQPKYNQYTGGKTPEEARREFIRQEKGNASLVERLPSAVQDIMPSRQTVAQYARPTLAGLGAALGGTVGATGGAAAGGIGAIPGGVAGSALGYAAGETIADLIGGQNPQTLIEAVARPAERLATGATYEMGGQVVGKAIGSGVDLYRNIKAGNVSAPFTDAFNQAKAGRILAENLPVNEVSTLNQLKSQRLLDRIGSTTTATPAQMTGSRSMAGLEQSAMSQNRGLAESIARQNADINRAGLSNITRTMGRQAAPLESQPLDTLGEKTRAAILNARTPLKEIEKQAWKEVPDYPMPINNTQSAIDELKSIPLPESVEKTVQSTINYIRKLPKTTKGMRAAEQTISGEITKAARAGDANIQARLYQLKNAIRDDFDELGRAAEQGDIAINTQGQIVYPAKLAEDLSKIEQRITEATANQKPDYETIRNALKNAGADYQTINKVDRYDNGLEQRMTEAYRKMISPDIPTTGDTKLIERLNADKSSIIEQLDNLRPADDAATTIKQARGVSRQINQKFKTGATKDVLARGDDLTGYRLKSEEIPRKYFTPTGINDLVRAVGNDDAIQFTTEYAKSELAKMTSNNGVLNVQKAYQWYKRNLPMLKTAGSDNNIKTIIREQLPASIQNSIASKAKFDIADNPIMTAREALKMYREYAPIMRQVYGGNSAEVQAMRDYWQTLNMLGRNQNVTTSGGSTTVEKGIDILFSNAPPSSLGGRIFSEVSGAILGGSAGTLIAGPVGGATGAILGTTATAASKAASAHSKDTIRKLLADAITDPELAKKLMDIRKGKKITKTDLSKWIPAAKATVIQSQLSTDGQPTE